MENGVNRSPVMLLTDDQDVVQLLHAVNLRQKLVDHGVVHACAAGARASLLADGVQLVEDDDMEPAVGSQLGTGQVEFNNRSVRFGYSSEHVETRAHPLLLLLCVGEQLADVGLRLSHVLVEDLRAVDDLRLAGVEHLANLPGHQSLTTARRPEQQDTLHVLAAWNREKKAWVRHAMKGRGKGRERMKWKEKE